VYLLVLSNIFSLLTKSAIRSIDKSNWALKGVTISPTRASGQATTYNSRGTSGYGVVIIRGSNVLLSRVSITARNSFLLLVFKF
jgi:hypothetical protein